MASPAPKLFQPIRVGTVNLQHRVVMGPMKRTCADDRHVPGALVLEYCKQRTSVPGTLAITEGTFIALHAGGQDNIPGIWNDEQIVAWKKVRSPFLTSLFDVTLTWEFPCRSQMQYMQTDRSFISSFGLSDVSQKETFFGKKETTRL